MINCNPDRGSILAAIEKLYSPEFERALGNVVNLFGEGGASEKILQILQDYPLNDL